MALAATRALRHISLLIHPYADRDWYQVWTTRQDSPLQLTQVLQSLQHRRDTMKPWPEPWLPVLGRRLAWRREGNYHGRRYACVVAWLCWVLEAHVGNARLGAS